MVGRWGMSDQIGPLAVTDGRQDGMLLPGASPASPAMLKRVDQEVERIVDTAENEVVELLRHERHRLDVLARALLDHETLDQDDAYRVAGVEPPGLRPRDENRPEPSGSALERPVEEA